jgi:GNAT superfamily N-acetyltransferase
MIANGSGKMISTNLTPSLETIAMVEKVEGHYFERFQTFAPAATREQLGIIANPVGDGIAVAMCADRSDYWSKALGFGFAVPIDDALIGETIEFFRKVGSGTAVLAVAPAVLPDDWGDICEAYRLTSTSSWAKLRCGVDKFRGGGTRHEVRELEEADAGAWNNLVRDNFGMVDPDLTPLLRSAITDPTTKVLGAWDGDLLIGAGAVYLFGDAASVNTGSTLESYRNQGVQSALLTARVNAARAAGCRWLVAETGSPDQNGVGGASFRNLIGAGFTHLYDRPNWRWREDQLS